MTVAELIEALQKCDQGLEVCAYATDDDHCGWETVWMVRNWTTADGKPIVQLKTEAR